MFYRITLLESFSKFKRTPLADKELPRLCFSVNFQKISEQLFCGLFLGVWSLWKLGRMAEGGWPKKVKNNLETGFETFLQSIQFLLLTKWFSIKNEAYNVNIHEDSKDVVGISTYKYTLNGELSNSSLWLEAVKKLQGVLATPPDPY